MPLVLSVRHVLMCVLLQHAACICLRAGEDIRSIHQGSWVAWKQLGDNAAAGGPLFVKDAFYNFLCPQRPRTV